MSLPLVPDANHPAFPTRSKVDDWEIKRPVPLDCAEEMAVIGRRCAQAKPSTKLIPTSRIGADPFDSEHRLKPAREQERAARPTRRAGQAERTQGHEAKRKNSGRPKEGPKKIKARASAWRNKRNKNRNGMETIQRPIQEIERNQNGKT